MRLAAELLLAFVALYPIVTAAVWIAGGVLFWLFDERGETHVPDGGWPGVTVLIPAYNEEQVIATSVRAALDADYPELEVLVLDDGSTDDTASAARVAAAGDPRFEVLRDPVNRGKAEQLNAGFARARHELVVVTDADTHMLPHALRRLAARMDQSELVAAVTGAPHVTNRGRLISAMQVLESASIIGLIRRTQALSGRVGIVAGVLGMFHRERVLAVGGYDSRMSTEDIDLTWRLLMAGWHTAHEPHALVGMQVPTRSRDLWAQRTRWARGQGEILHEHLRAIAAWRNRRMWPLGLESVASLVWVTALGAGHRPQRPVRRQPRSLRIRHGVGHRHLGCGHPAACRRARAALPLRPLRPACVRDRGAVPTVLLDGVGVRGVALAGRGDVPRTT